MSAHPRTAQATCSQPNRIALTRATDGQPRTGADVPDRGHTAADPESVI